MHYKPSNKDTDRLCDSLEMKIRTADEVEQKSLAAEQEIHIRKAEQVRTALRTYKEKASNDVYTCTFNLLKVFLFPRLTISIAYYKHVHVQFGSPFLQY